MQREKFVRIVEQVLETLPAVFRNRIHNLAIRVEDFPPGQHPSTLHPVSSASPPAVRRLIMGVFIGVPATQKSVFNLPIGPDQIILYRRNIEAVCSNDAEIKEQTRRTVLHELGHYFGLSEKELKDL